MSKTVIPTWKKINKTNSHRWSNDSATRWQFQELFAGMAKYTIFIILSEKLFLILFINKKKYIYLNYLNNQVSLKNKNMWYKLDKIAGKGEYIFLLSSKTNTNFTIIHSDHIVNCETKCTTFKLRRKRSLSSEYKKVF